MVSGLEDILQSLIILFDTSLGERVMQPKYGASLKDFIFEPMNTALLIYLEDLTRTAIIYHEARIELLGVHISTEFMVEGRLDFNISFIVRGTNSRYNFVYPFYLKEGLNPG